MRLRIAGRNQVAATEQVVEWAAVDLVVTFVAVGTLNLLDQLVDEKLVEECTAVLEMVVFVASVAATRTVVETVGPMVFVVGLEEQGFLFAVVLAGWTVDESICPSADLVRSRLLVRRW